MRKSVMSNRLIAMVGLPRSGKSTISRELSRQLGCPIVNRDALRLAIHGQRYAAAAEPMIKTVSLYMIRALFLTGHDTVIYDETNYSRAARDYIKDLSWQTLFYVVPTPPQVCQERAVATNQEDLVKVIEEMANRYEPLGWDEAVYHEENGVQEGPGGRHEMGGTGSPQERIEAAKGEARLLGIPNGL